MKIALTLIVKSDKEEAALLDRCLGNMSPHMDGIFITETLKPGAKPSKDIDKVCKKYKAVRSTFEWTGDFSAARNHSFKSIPEGFDYIMWSDADDLWRGLEKLKPTLEETNKDAYAFWYLYDFDEYKQPIVSHRKTMIVKPGCAVWKGRIHEDLQPLRQIDIHAVEGIERMHFTNEKRIVASQQRNLEIAKDELNQNPNDPRAHWNHANALIGAGDTSSALKELESFIETSGSEDEIYIARMRLGSAYASVGKKKDAKEQMVIAIGSKPEFPDAYLQYGQMFYTWNEFQNAKRYLLEGLKRKPSYQSMIVFNPRDYDYNPMMLLAKTYFMLNQYAEALAPLKTCLKLYPEHKHINGLISAIEKEIKSMDDIADKVEHLKGKDKDFIKSEIEKLEPKYRSHPAICKLYNTIFTKETSSGKDLVIYCGYTTHLWNPDTFLKAGVGGSEEAVMHLSRMWAKNGYNVTVYNNGGNEVMVRDGVTWKPFWMYNYRDKQDITILWRSPKLADYEINSTKVFVDMHDVMDQGEFTKPRLQRIDKIFVKTKAHRSLFPGIADDKFAIVPNGLSVVAEGMKPKDQYLMINTSSPDRSLDVLPEIFKRIKKEVPEARMQWAYGWEIFNNAHEENPTMLKWRDKIIADMEEAGIENLGRLPQGQVAKLYHEGNVLLYPTEFFETDCISVKKAQAAGCIPVTTDFSALDESVVHGVKIHSEKTKENYAIGRIAFGVQDEAQKQRFVDEAVRILRQPLGDRSEMINWAKKFEWQKIASEWQSRF